MSKRYFKGDNLIVKVNGAVVLGNDCTIQASDVTVIGDRTIAYGTGNKLNGNDCTAYGDNCTITGNRGKIYGKRGRIYGQGGKIEDRALDAEASLTGSSILKKRKASDIERNTSEITVNGKTYDFIFDSEESCFEVFEKGDATKVLLLRLRPGEAKDFEGVHIVFEQGGKLVVPKGADTEETWVVHKKVRPPETLLGKDVLKNLKPCAPPQPCPPHEDEPDAPPDCDQSQTCLICYSKLRSVLFKPCKHLACCVKCTRNLYFGKFRDKWLCPVCKQEVLSAEKVIRP